MNKKILTIAIFPLLALNACATQKTLIPTGGSKADGIVSLSYEVGMFEQPIVDYSQGVQAAIQRCEAWGYSDAEAFGGQESRCQAYNGYGNCVRQMVTVKYQCID